MGDDLIGLDGLPLRDPSLERFVRPAADAGLREEKRRSHTRVRIRQRRVAQRMDDRFILALNSFVRILPLKV